MEFKTKPFVHQLTELDARWNLPAWALLWEQGTGKSKPTVDTAARLYEAGSINAAVIVAPGGVHRNWIEGEIPTHLPECVLVESKTHCFQSSKASTQRHKRALQSVLEHEGLAWVAFSYDAVSTKAGHKALAQFLTKRKCFYVLDEAQAIKNPEAERTRTVLRSAKFAEYRRILTGTPIAQGPFDLYTQFWFLDSEFWKREGIGSFTEFKLRYAEWTKTWNPTAFNPATGHRSGRAVDVLKSYRRLDELAEIIKKLSSRVTKDEVLDLPPKLYTKRYFSLSPEQERHYQELREEFLTWIQLHPEESTSLLGGTTQQLLGSVCEACGGTREVILEGMVYPCTKCPPPVAGGDTLVAAPLAMVRLLRLQQVTCGYLPTDNEEEPTYLIPGVNRRLNTVLDVCEESAHKVIVWARFKMDITLILAGLKERGIRAVRYDGAVNEEGRAESKALFTGKRPTFTHGRWENVPIPEDEQAKVFVGNPAAGATGLTLVEAKTVIYYNNSFKLLDRVQSEDRAHRIGQTNQVLYVDIVADGTVDDKIANALRTKKNIADIVLGDEIKEWI